MDPTPKMSKCVGGMSHTYVKGDHSLKNKTDRQASLGPLEQCTGMEFDRLQARGENVQSTKRPSLQTNLKWSGFRDKLTGDRKRCSK